MKKTIFALAAAATIAIGTLAAPQSAQARCWNCGFGLGILGGIVAGTIIGTAIASHPGYYAYDDYYAEPPYDCDGYWARRPIRDGYGNVVGWSRPRYFCR
jgi:hypothetical protein